MATGYEVPMNPGRIKPLWALLFFALSLALLNRLNQYQVSQDPRHQLPFPVAIGESDISPSAALFSLAYQRRVSGMLGVEGKIAHLFSGEETGKGYQKFTLQLGKGQSVVVLHNTELGAVIEGLTVGESIEVYGEYQWAEDGGVIQWTHQNPAHETGWVKYKGRIYR
jgi:hypothetical protein